jgi:putative transposase
MLVINQKTNQNEETHMKNNTQTIDAQSALINDREFLREATKRFLQNILEEEFIEHIGASRYERSQERTGYRNGSYERQLKTRVGAIELTVPRDRDGIFERYQRSEKSLVLALAEMYFRGVSTRKITQIVEELCGHGISKSQVSELSKQLDQDLKEWRNRPLNGGCEYLLLDAIYQKVRDGGKVNSVATFVAVGIDRLGQREVLGCHVATSEHQAEWTEFLRALKSRGLNTPQMVISDDHDGLRNSIQKELTGAMWQRCQVHYMRNFSGKLPSKHKPELIPLLRDVFDSEDIEVAKSARSKLLDRLMEEGLEGVADWIEESIDDTLNVLNLPGHHRKRMKSTNMLERLNEEIRRRTRVIRIFPNRDSCTRVITSICQEISESWEGRRYLNFEGLE